MLTQKELDIQEHMKATILNKRKAIKTGVTRYYEFKDDGVLKVVNNLESGSENVNFISYDEFNKQLEERIPGIDQTEFELSVLPPKSNKLEVTHNGYIFQLQLGTVIEPIYTREEKELAGIKHLSYLAGCMRQNVVCIIEQEGNKIVSVVVKDMEGKKYEGLTKKAEDIIEGRNELNTEQDDWMRMYYIDFVEKMTTVLLDEPDLKEIVINGVNLHEYKRN